MPRMLAGCAALICSYWPWAIAHAQQSTESITSPLSTLVKLAVALVFVLVLFFIFAKLMKKMQVGQGGGSNGLKVVGALSLGPRERIVVVQAGSEQILLGVTSTQINKLHILGDPLGSGVASEADGGEKVAI